VAGSILVGACIHATFPASRPEPHPLHPGQALIHWSSLQVPLNTLPSMHTVFAVLIVTFAFAAWTQPLARAAFLVPAVLTVISTLTLKEHVMLDLVAGLALGGGAAAWWVRGRRQLGPQEGGVR
jgi:membrane-associated phospholipid phosphatase